MQMQYWVLESTDTSGFYLVDESNRIVFYPIAELAEAHRSNMAHVSGVRTAGRWKVVPLGTVAPTTPTEPQAAGRKPARTERRG